MAKVAMVSVLAVSVHACATSGVNRGDFNLITLEEEWELGNRFESDLAGKLELVRDRNALGYLDGVGQRIVRQTELARLPWKFHLVADPEVNAFNVPGGHVYVNTGLVTAAANAAELAGVLAHEVAHGVARHGTEQLSKAYGFNVVAGIALGQSPSLYEKLLAQVVGAGAFARFSRDDEREADRLGVRYMFGAGYDPEGMASMFEELLSRRKRKPGSVQQFFASHPLTETRIAEVREQIRNLPERADLRTQDPGFPEVQRRLTRYNNP